MNNFMDLSRALKSLADAFHTIKLKLDGLYDSAGAIGNQFELIETVTLEEAVASIEFSELNLKKAIVTINMPVSDATRFALFLVNNTHFLNITNIMDANNTKYSFLISTSFVKG